MVQKTTLSEEEEGKTGNSRIGEREREEQEQEQEQWSNGEME